MGVGTWEDHINGPPGGSNNLSCTASKSSPNLASDLDRRDQCKAYSYAYRHHKKKWCLGSYMTFTWLYMLMFNKDNDRHHLFWSGQSQFHDKNMIVDIFTNGFLFIYLSIFLTKSKDGYSISSFGISCYFLFIQVLCFGVTFSHFQIFGPWGQLKRW